MDPQISAHKLATQSRADMTNQDQITELPQKVDSKYMGRRIYSQNLKDVTKVNKLNSEFITKNDNDIPEYHSRSLCKCK